MKHFIHRLTALLLTLSLALTLLTPAVWAAEPEEEHAHAAGEQDPEAPGGGDCETGGDTDAPEETPGEGGEESVSPLRRIEVPTSHGEAPDYTVIAADGSVVSTAAYKNRARVIVFFYLDQGANDDSFLEILQTLQSGNWSGVDLLFVNIDSKSDLVESFLSDIGSVYPVNGPAIYATASNGADILSDFEKMYGEEMYHGYDEHPLATVFFLNGDNEMIYGGDTLPTNLDSYMESYMAVEDPADPEELTPVASGTKIGVCGANAWWTFTGDGTLTIHGEGALWGRDGSPSLHGWVDDEITTSASRDTIRRGDITSMIIGSGITLIESDFFDQCGNLATVTFTGDAPEIDEPQSCVRFTAYYPAGNESWTDEVRGKLDVNWVAQGPTPIHIHTPVWQEALAPTCTEDGHEAHWYCAGCDTCFQDENATVPVDAASLTIPATGHSIIAVAEVPASCTVAGTAAHWRCESCRTLFSDKDGESIIEAASLVIEALGHDYVPEVTNPTCTVGGFTTYTCSHCGDTCTGDETPAMGHDYQVTVTEPSCTEEGFTTHTCSRCGDSYTDSQTPALGHDYVPEVTEPSCTVGGFTTYTCSHCGDTYTGDETPALGHDYVPEVTNPTCTVGGFTTYTCSHCGDTYTGDETDALGHDYVDQVTDSTCTEEGFTTHTCSRCGDSYTDSQTPALGHDYVPEVTEPSCTVGGFTTYTCSHCGDSYTDSETPALGHAFVDEVTEPSCTEAGKTVTTCSRCDYHDETVIPATGHDWGEWTETDHPTCTAAGSQTRTCKHDAGHTETQPVAALGHSLAAVPEVPATCTATGVAAHWRCERCQALFSDENGTTIVEAASLVIPVLDHDYKAAVTERTCTTGGYTTHTCSRCNDSFTDSETAALGHDYSAVVTDPTCTAGGYTTHTCSRCSDSYTDSETTALGHDCHDEVTEATCTGAGLRVTACSRCDYRTETVIPATGHDWGEWTVTGEPTCTGEGSQTRTCKHDASHTETRKIAALGHDLTNVAAVPATCTTAGATAHNRCERCGKLFLADNGSSTPIVESRLYVPATGHSWSDWERLTAPTLSAEGLERRTCAVCSATEERTVAKLTDIASAEVTGIANKTYTGSALTQSPTVKLSGKTLKLNTDYTLSYSNNVKAGTATVKITGKGSCGGSLSKTFKISPLSLSKATVTGVTNKTYTGKALKQTPTVKLAGKTLKSGTDYTLSYSANTKVGKATVKITGKGNYTGTLSRTFSILPKPAAISTLTAGTKQATVKWKKIAGVGGYQIQYSTSKTFASGNKSVSVSGAGTLSRVVKSLTKGKVWYFRIRTWQKVSGTTYYSTWSAVKSVKITK